MANESDTDTFGAGGAWAFVCFRNRPGGHRECAVKNELRVKPLPGGELCKRGGSGAWAGLRSNLKSRSGRAGTRVVFIYFTVQSTVLYSSNFTLQSCTNASLFVHQVSDLIYSQKCKEYDGRAHVKWAKRMDLDWRRRRRG